MVLELYALIDQQNQGQFCMFLCGYFYLFFLRFLRFNLHLVSSQFVWDFCADGSNIVN